jgi:hypothetical protein
MGTLDYRRSGFPACGLKFDERQIAARAHFTNLDALPKTSAAPAILAPLFKLEP